MPNRKGVPKKRRRLQNKPWKYLDFAKGYFQRASKRRLKAKIKESLNDNIGLD